MNTINIKEALANAEVLRQSGNIEGAFELNQLITQMSPKSTEAWYNLGCIASDMQRYDLAEEFFTEALKWNKRNPDYFNALGEVQQQQHKFAAAKSNFEKALKRNKQSIRAINNMGQLYYAMGDYEKAKKEFSRGLRLAPNELSILLNLSTVLIEADEHKQAHEVLEKATTQYPSDIRLKYNQAKTNYSLNNYAETLDTVEQALNLNPDAEMASQLYNIRGNHYKKINRFDTALNEYRKAIELDSTQVEPHTSTGLIKLTRGELKDGWYEMSWSILKSSFIKKIDAPTWHGEDIENKNLVYLAEQGVGDEILYANMFPDLIRNTGNCTIECDHRLIPLFSRSFPTARFVTRQLPPRDELVSENYDYKTWPTNTALHLRSSLDRFPVSAGYLTPNAERVTYWNEQLNNIDRNLKVGICWRSMNMSSARSWSYSDITTEWDEILKIEGVTFINLQYDNCEEELETVKIKYDRTIHNLDLDLMNDFDETASLIASLDLVISSHTAIASLAGAIGKKCYVLTNSGNWTRLGSDNFPWYPNSLAVLQDPKQNWKFCFEDLAEELENFKTRVQYGNS